MKKSYVVIGMGRFGTSVAERLYELGNEVLAIDTNPDKVQRMESKVTCAVVADVRDEEVLRSLGARSARGKGCFVRGAREAATARSLPLARILQRASLPRSISRTSACRR